MCFIFVLLAIAQLQGQIQCTSTNTDIQKEVSNFAFNIKVPSGYYELRRVSQDEIGSIQPDRIVFVQKDQSPLFTRTQTSFSNGQEYSAVQTGYQLESGRNVQQYQTVREAQANQENYHEAGVKRESGSASRSDYLQTQGNYQTQRRAQDYPIANANSVLRQQETSHNYHENSQPGVQSTYQAQQRQQMEGANDFHDPRAEYMQSPQNYQQAKSEPQQTADGYQIVNEGPAAHVVSISASGGVSSVYYPHDVRSKLSGDYQVVNENPQAELISGQNYMTAQNQFYSPQRTEYPEAASGHQYTQSQNELYMPYERSFIGQERQPEVQYDVRKSQRRSI